MLHDVLSVLVVHPGIFGFLRLLKAFCPQLGNEMLPGDGTNRLLTMRLDVARDRLGVE